MDLRQVMQSIFGDQSEEDAEWEKKVYHKANFYPPEIEETDESKGKAEDTGTSEPKGVCHDHLGGLRSTETDKCEDQDLHRAIFRNLFGDSDSDERLEPKNGGKVESIADKKVGKTGAPRGSVHHDHLESSRSFADSKGDVPRKYVVHDRINDENVRRPLKYKGNHAKVLLVENVLTEEVTLLEVLEIPFHRPSVRPDQMAAIRLSNIIGIDPKPMDSSTYVEDEFYVTTASGSKKRIPHTNIIRWKKIRKADGTTLVESNARFVIWSDGSLQLLIGDQAFDVCEHDIQDIQLHLFLRHAEGIYQSQGRISKKMKIRPSSSHHFLPAAPVDSRHRKENKVRQYITDVDPERTTEQMDKAATETTKVSKHRNNKKQVTEKYRYMGRKEHQHMPGFLPQGPTKNSKESGSKQQIEVDEDTLPTTATRRLMYYRDDE